MWGLNTYCKMKRSKKKKTLNAIITKAYQSRCSCWKPISEARIVFQFVHAVNKDSEKHRKMTPNSAIFDYQLLLSPNKFPDAT